MRDFRACNDGRAEGTFRVLDSASHDPLKGCAENADGVHMRSFDLVVIGSGPAGEKAALQAASFGRRVAVVEMEPRPGGAMVNTGTIASKALRETALVASALRRRPIPGWSQGTERDRLSMARFMARRTLVQMEEHDRIEADFDDAGVVMIRGRGTIIDASTVEVMAPDGHTERLATAFIMIATGSSPARGKQADFTLPGVVDANGILELDFMPRSLVVVGGGVIGCEYASIFAELGVEVTLIEPRVGLMRFLDVDIRGVLEAGMSAAGIAFRFGQTVARVGADGTTHARGDGHDHVTTELSSGECLSSECVLWSLGRQGNTRQLGLERVGVQADDRGNLAVDREYRTSCPSVFAGGDVIGFPALASTSMEQGRIAACRMFGIPFHSDLAATIPIGIYTIPAVAAVGKTAEEAIAAGMDVVTGCGYYRNNPRGRMLGDDRGLLKAVFDRSNRRLIGVSIVGEDATELVHLAQWAIASGHGIDFLVETCFNYPSLSDLYKDAAYDALRAFDQPAAKAA